MGKSRKLPTAMRETIKQRAATFSKRRQGLFNKAAEISMLCDARVAVLVSSLPSSKPKVYSFGYPSVDAVFDAFLRNRALDDAHDHDETKNSAFSLWEETMGLDRCTQKIKKRKNSPEEFRMDPEELETSNSVQELQALVKALENLRDKAVTKMQKQWPQFPGSGTSSCSSSTSVGATAIAVNNENYKLDAAEDDNNYNYWQLDRADNCCDIGGTKFFDPSNSLVPKTEPAPGETHYCNNFISLLSNNGYLDTPANLDFPIDVNTAGNQSFSGSLHRDQDCILLDRNFDELAELLKSMEDDCSVSAIESGNGNGCINNDVVGKSNNDGPCQYFNTTEDPNSSCCTNLIASNFDLDFGDIDEAILQAEILKNNMEGEVGSGDSNCDFSFLIEGADNGASTSSGCSEAIDDQGCLSLPFYTSINGVTEFEDMLLDEEWLSC